MPNAVFVHIQSKSDMLFQGISNSWDCNCQTVWEQAFTSDYAFSILYSISPNVASHTFLPRAFKVCLINKWIPVIVIFLYIGVCFIFFLEE